MTSLSNLADSNSDLSNNNPHPSDLERSAVGHQVHGAHDVHGDFRLFGLATFLVAG